MPATPANDLHITTAGIVTFDGTATFSAATTTAHDVLVGAASNGITNVAPSATSGIPLVSNGASSDPSFTTAVVAGGGTGVTTIPAYALVCGGTTTTGAIQSVADVATGSVLVSGGTAALPSFSATPTVTSITLGAGTALSSYVVGTWTPVLNFGGATTGITYSTQTGQYTRIGNVVFCMFVIALTSKGSATGSATITGLPVATGGSGGNNTMSSTYISGVTLSSSYTMLTMGFNNSASLIRLVQIGSNIGSQNLSDTNVSNTSQFAGNFFYLLT